MKKIRYILLCAALMFTLAACGSEPGNTANDVDNGNNMMNDAGNAVEDVGNGIVNGVEDVGNGIKDGMNEMTGNGSNSSGSSK